MTADARLVVLDRDGVVTVEVEGWISDPRELRFETNSIAGLRTLASAGIALAIATNQSGIGRGVVDAEAVRAVHAELLAQLRDHGVEIAEVFVCAHVDDDRCRCRKPGPGLLEQAIERFDVRPTETWFVGDMERDLAAGRAAGVHVALVRTGKGRATATTLADDTPVFDDLLAFAEWCLRQDVA